MSIVSVNGVDVYKSNKPLRDLATIMEHPESKAFFDSYFNTSSDAMTMIMMMKIYKRITDLNPDMNGYDKIGMLASFLKDSTIRRKIVLDFQDWQNDLTNEQFTKNNTASIHDVN